MNVTIPGLPLAATMAPTDLIEICAAPATVPVSKRVTKATAQAPDFTSTLLTILDHQPYNIAHGLGVIPSRVRWVLACIATDLSGFQAGDEIELFGWLTDIGAGGIMVCTSWANVTNINLSAAALFIGNENSMDFSQPSAEGYTNISDFNNFRIKGYAWV